MQQSMFSPEEWVLSVTQLNEYVRKTLATDPMLARLKLRGEISNFKRHSSGHLYFTLKDELARIQCMMFRQHALSLGLQPREGMRVVLTGQVGLYARDGQYQFYAERMRAEGVGDLYQRFEELKQKLTAEGLFDVSRKRPLPLFPKVVGVVTSPTGAAVRDIIRVAKARYPGVRILLYPALVQGEGAAASIAKGIAALGKRPGVEVMIVGRGGGSLEDLWAFNEELVARAIAASPVPVISAVGHETDTTISDFAADVRAATPSAAAMLAVPDAAALKRQSAESARRLFRLFASAWEGKAQRLDRARLMLLSRAPDRLLRQWETELSHAGRRLRAGMGQRLVLAETGMTLLRRQLEALGPARVLNRGYAYVRQGGRAIPDAASAATGKAALIWRDGSASIEIQEIERAEVKHGSKEKTEL